MKKEFKKQRRRQKDEKEKRTKREKEGLQNYERIPKERKKEEIKKGRKTEG